MRDYFARLGYWLAIGVLAFWSVNSVLSHADERMPGDPPGIGGGRAAAVAIGEGHNSKRRGRNAEVLDLVVTPLPQPDPSSAAVLASDILPFQDKLGCGPPVLRLDELPDDPDRPTPCEIVLRNKVVQVHSALGRTTPIWSYDVYDARNQQWLCDDSFLGPTIVVRRGQRVAVTYRNSLHGYLPTTAILAKLGTKPDLKADPLTANLPGPVLGPGADFDATIGPEPGTVDQDGSPVLYGWTVTHLHGARTAAMYDGWTENAMLPPRKETDGTSESPRPGQTQVSVHENDQRATMLWYHDHAMGITRLNVVAGLVGAYLIRDPAEEKRLADAKVILPTGHYEVPLVIQDRNLDTDATGMLTGRLMHKVTDGTAEFFAPYTLVNGIIWPKMPVERRRYRLRLLNGSNARTYCLRLLECTGTNMDGTPIYGRDFTNDFGTIFQIGSDGGLLAEPILLPNEGLFLAPAERADLVVDFGKLPNATEQAVLVNTAFAPFQNTTVRVPGSAVDPTTGQPFPPSVAGTSAPGLRLPYPFAMRFDLGDRPANDSSTPLADDAGKVVALADDVPPLSHDDLPHGHTHRWIALTESPPGHLFFRELEPATTDPVIAAALPPSVPLIAISGQDGVTTWYRTAAMAFDDDVRIHVRYGGWEVWNLVNLTTDTHPIHLHLVQFRVLERAQYTTSSYDSPSGTTKGAPIAFASLGVVDANEQGFKDTIRVNPSEVVTIAARFDGFTGRYMYHCHILEHEDMDMMRPFIVVPTTVLDLMGGGMSGMPMH